jgi:hypothetical protein
MFVPEGWIPFWHPPYEENCLLGTWRHIVWYKFTGFLFFSFSPRLTFCFLLQCCSISETSSTQGPYSEDNTVHSHCFQGPASSTSPLVCCFEYELLFMELNFIYRFRFCKCTTISFIQWLIQNYEFQLQMRNFWIDFHFSWYNLYGNRLNSNIYWTQILIRLSEILFMKPFNREDTTVRQPLWSNCQSSWLQIQWSGFDLRRYQIFWEVVGLERGPLSLVSTIEELLGRKSSGSGLENREYGRRDSVTLTTWHPLSAKSWQ